MNYPDKTKRRLSQAMAVSPIMGLLSHSPLAQIQQQTIIAFGSCLHQDKEQPIWEAVLQQNPQLFIFLGDNIYGDSDDPQVLAAKYAQLAQKPGFQALRQSTEVAAIWDDHDFGANDVGKEFPIKEASRELMLSFWNEPADSERWSRPDGIYTAFMFGEAGRRVQVILLDLRWNRTSLNMVANEAEWREREDADMGPYKPVQDADAVMLGEDQWQWLAGELAKPADVRVIGSSIQMIADFTGWESWANFPHERERLLKLLSEYQDAPYVIISGDTHWCELSRLEHPDLHQPLVELTSSGLTEIWEKISPNQHRASSAHAVQNFGLIKIDWQENGPAITLQARDVNGDVLITYDYPG
jgi:alkaline phosphatase D